MRGSLGRIDARQSGKIIFDRKFEPLTHLNAELYKIFLAVASELNFFVMERLLFEHGGTASFNMRFHDRKVVSRIRRVYQSNVRLL